MLYPRMPSHCQLPVPHSGVTHSQDQVVQQQAVAVVPCAHLHAKIHPKWHAETAVVNQLTCAN